MKKSIITALLSCVACAAFAGTQPIVAPTPVVEAASPLYFTVKGGIMYQTVSDYDDAGSTNLPSLLYGFSVSVEKELIRNGDWSQLLGISIGYYSGSEKTSYNLRNSETKKDSFHDVDVDVNAIPLMLTYDFRYEMNSSLSFFAGGRAGVMFRMSEATGSVKVEGVTSIFDDDSFKAVPMVGVGFGAQAYLSDSWTLTFSVDVLATFGNDCDRLYTTDREWYLTKTNKHERLSTVVSVGATYTF